MKKFDKICMYIFFALGAFGLYMSAKNELASTENTRNLEYEAYCDSVFNADPDYYLDVLCTTDEYQDYIEANGKWWEE